MLAVAIVSGGMDSTVLAYMLKDAKYDLKILSFNYGQKHKKELKFAGRTARALNAQHEIIDMSALTSLIGNSALTSDKEVPEGHYAADNMAQTIVPNRNMMMLAIAGAVAVNDKAHLVAAGMHAGDHAIYPDCRPEFIETFEVCFRVGNAGFITRDFHICAPFLKWTKAEIAERGHMLGVPFADTWSCYVGGAVHCGRCGTCVERAEAFHIAKVPDPTIYQDPNYWKEAVSV